jgi:hypothetical protein
MVAGEVRITPHHLHRLPASELLHVLQELGGWVDREFPSNTFQADLEISYKTVVGLL